MLKNWTIAAAISSALLALALVGVAPAATPVASVSVRPKSASPPDANGASGDYDRAFAVQRAGEASNDALQAGDLSARPISTHPRPDPAAVNRVRPPGPSTSTGPPIAIH